MTVVRALSPQSASGVSTQTPPSGALSAPRPRSGSRVIRPPFRLGIFIDSIESFNLGAVSLASEEPFTLGSVNTDSVEPFDIDQSDTIVDAVEPFWLLGPASLSSAEPFALGETAMVGSIEVFNIRGPEDSWLGVGSPAWPKLGWRDRTQ